MSYNTRNEVAEEAYKFAKNQHGYYNHVMQKTKQYRASEEDAEFEFNGKHLSFVRRSMQLTNISFAIDEAVKEPAYYRNIVEELQNLGSHDTVQVRINSTGGRLDGLVALLEAIRQTEAQVLAVIAGECHSAASMLALSCPNIIVSPYSSMMIHNVSYGTAGKDADIIGQVHHISDYSKKLVYGIYQGFLTDKEIEEVINGKEFWFQAPEIEERLEKRKKYFDKLNKPKKEPKLKSVDTNITV